ncbi:hypothetical protein J4439_01810 [Candidatus Woesearchaeota archaeon]|nr:hypothetical protein [Candidatus Woesearchaeota archaeon]
MGLEHKIFASEGGDWYVLARKGTPPIVLYEGHHRELAYEALFRDLGISVSIEERDMDDIGTYIPTEDDFASP